MKKFSKLIKTSFVITLLLTFVIVFVLLWWFFFREEPLVGIIYGNGRLEATEVDVSTKFYGKVIQVLVDQGDLVVSGDVVAKMDIASLEAQLREAEALLNSAEKKKAYSDAIVLQKKIDCKLAKKNLAREKKLYKHGIISLETLDSYEAAYEVTESLCKAAEAEVENAKASIDAAKAKIDRLKTDINDSILTAPLSGRVQYRLAEPGEILPAGGKVLTIIDLDDFYMNIFLSEIDAGKVAVGSDAKTVFDALPDSHFPAKVTYVAPKSQFTPKEVETKTERQKLSFRVEVTLQKTNSKILKPGMPGVTYIKTDDLVKWPENL